MTAAKKLKDACLLLERKAMTNLNSVLCFPGGSAGKEFSCNAGDLGSIPGLGRFPWRRERQTESFGKHNCGNNAPSTVSRHRKLYAERGLESVTVLALLILSRGWGGGASFKNEKLVLKKRLALFYFLCKMTVWYL